MKGTEARTQGRFRTRSSLVRGVFGQSVEGLGLAQLLAGLQGTGLRKPSNLISLLLPSLAIAGLGNNKLYLGKTHLGSSLGFVVY